jgi:hypothetical protein
MGNPWRRCHLSLLQKRLFYASKRAPVLFSFGAVRYGMVTPSAQWYWERWGGIDSTRIIWGDTKQMCEFEVTTSLGSGFTTAISRNTRTRATFGSKFMISFSSFRQNLAPGNPRLTSFELCFILHQILMKVRIEKRGFFPSFLFALLTLLDLRSKDKTSIIALSVWPAIGTTTWWCVHWSMDCLSLRFGRLIWYWHKNWLLAARMHVSC